MKATTREEATRRAAAKAARYEVHEHSFTRGPRAQLSGARSHLVHSHAGGDVPHEHADTGPASFTIDKDQWLRRTGLHGGGRKKFTATPSGEQLPVVAIDPADLEFDVIYCTSAMQQFRDGDAKSTGGGNAATERISLAFGMKPRFRVVP
jgi:hypothetical protein